MRLKVTLRRPSDEVDLSITADATASVADIARHLAAADPSTTGVVPEDLTLRVTDVFAGAEASRVIEGETSILDAGIRSGSRIELVRAFPGQSGGHAQAMLRVLSGPDAGREFPLPGGATVIGRDHGVDLRLTDPLISKRHARISVGAQIEITDLNSANGVLLSGDPVSRAVLTPSEVVVLGETSLCVLPLGQAGGAPGPVVEHVRSPRVVPRYPGGEFTPPKPPGVIPPQRFPMVALAAPLIMGGVLWVVTQQLMSVLFMALTPLLLIGAFLDQRSTARKTLKTQRQNFDAGMLALQARLEREREVERRARLAETPPTAAAEQAIEQLSPLLWTRRPEHGDFLRLNLGIGRAASRNTVPLPSSNDTYPEFWDQLLALQAEFAQLDRVPILADLRDCGAVGVAGPVAARGAAARGLVLQLLALHSPAEVVLAALVSPGSKAGWEWLTWTPHTTSSHSPLEGEHIADGPAAASGLLSQLEGLIDARTEGGPKPRGAERKPEQTQESPVLPAVIVLVEDDAPVDRGRLTRLAETGADAGVHVVWCAEAVSRLPAACRTYLSVDTTDAGAVVGQVRDGDLVHPVAVDQVSADRAERLARALSPVVDIGSPEADDSDLPRQVSYADLAGRETLDSAGHVVDRWRENNSLVVRDGSPPVRRKKEGNLRALVGHAGAAPFFLDLRRDGPHALVGGTTGAGKSEFLQSWVLGMAAAHSPDRLTFLFVDYKGGAAFADAVLLPHTVGLVTDLSPHLVRRALTSLRAELRHREHLLQRKKAKDLISLEKTGDPDCPPSLIIVVDEFAALVQEVPEFVDGVVDVAQRGRSLGLHLVLATQRPAGVIKDNLRANTNLRIALRMADTDDSVDILGDPMAAHFDPSIPGRGAAKTGPGRLQPFQTGYAGGWTSDAPPRPRIDVTELAFGAGALWEVPEAGAVVLADPGPPDIARMVATISAAAGQAGVPAPRKPWLPELAAVYNLALLPNPRTDEKLLLGVLDDPASQAQPTIAYEPDKDGNMAIFGTGGSGKSTALRTIAAASAFTARGGPIHVYGLDFGSGGLRMLEDLPHVGAVIDGDDEERVIRLLRMIRDVVDERAARYAAVRAGTIAEYRLLAKAPDEPRYLLLVDGIGGFRERYEFGSAQNAAWFTAFAQIAADGRPVGVHVVMTGDRPNAVPNSISSTVQRRVVLRLADPEEYLMLGVPKDVLESSSPPGRGILDGDEVQFAILGDSPNVAVQSRAVQALAEGMRSNGRAPAAEIRRLPDQVWLRDLAAGAPEAVVFGVDDVTLGAATLAPSGTLLLAGPPGSGRTTALDTLAAAVAAGAPDLKRVFLGARRSALAQRPGWVAAAQGPSEVAALADRLAAELEAAPMPVAIFVEHLTEFASGEAEFALDRLIKAAIRADGFVVGEAETSTWSQAWTLAQPFKAGRRGLLLAPGEMDGDTLLGTGLGRLRRADFPAGRGFLIESGRARKVQVAQR